MKSEQVEQLIALYGSKLPIYSIPEVRKKLAGMDYSIVSLNMSKLKDPTISIILSILVGTFGIDRFYIGNIGLGILKLITCGGLGIWWIVDLFLIMDTTREHNLKSLMGITYQLLNHYVMKIVKQKKIDLREMWRFEAQDFTP